MQLYAYRVTLTLKDGVDPNSQEFQDDLETNRQAVRRRIELFGGDPLPSEQIMLSVTEDQIILLWRSLVEPTRTDLLGAIQAFAATLTLIDSWVLEYHRCGNGRHRPCGGWQTLIEV